MVVMLIAILLSALIFFVQGKRADTYRLEARVFEVTTGWGYDILVNDTLFIRQESIPSLPAQRGFEKKEQAERTASLIINKLKAGHPPTVSTLEVQTILQHQ